MSSSSKPRKTKSKKSSSSKRSGGGGGGGLGANLSPVAESHRESDDYNSPYNGDDARRQYNYQHFIADQQQQQSYPQHIIDDDEDYIEGGGQQQQQQHVRRHSDERSVSVPISGEFSSIDYNSQQRPQNVQRHASDTTRRRPLDGAEEEYHGISPPPFRVDRNLYEQQSSNTDQYSTHSSELSVSTGSGSGSGSGNNGGYNLAADSTVSPPTSTKNSEEADLLQRAIERRAALQNRIVAMEAAKAELELRDCGSSVGSAGSSCNNSPKGHRRTNSNPNKRIRTPNRERGHNRHPSDEGNIPQQREGFKKEIDSSGGDIIPDEGYKSTSMRHPPNSVKTTEYTNAADELFSSISNEAEQYASSSDIDIDREGDNASPFDETSIDKPPRKERMGEHHARMNELSERIKREAIEFMNYKSSYVESPPDEMERNVVDENNFMNDTDDDENDVAHDNDFMNDDDDDRIREEGMVQHYVNELLSNSGGFSTEDDMELEGIAEEDEGEEDSYDSSNIIDEGEEQPVAISIDSSAWDNGQVTSQQSSRYSNMVRLGIPDVAILRSMERDGLNNTEEILQQLKDERNTPAAVGSSIISSDRQATPQRESTNRQASIERSATNNNSEDTSDDDRRLTLPLSDDPNYSKYFKMLKAKVPLSWVRRVLEVDGKDARVLDLDPNQPLGDQVPSGALDELGNINWDNVDLRGRTLSGDSSVEETKTHSSSSVSIPADTYASVKAELIAMSAKAGEMTNGLRTVPSDEEPSDSSRPPSRADITSAAVAASNERMDRLSKLGLRAVTSSRDIGGGKRRQTSDEIRRRHNPPPSSNSTSRRTFPPSSSTTTASQSSKDQTSDKSMKDLPLKDDPRFSKYFQMIRSRVPRSWVERVIEVDDRDPAILDLDPNKSLASQIGEEDVDEEKDEIDTIDSTFADSSLKTTPTVSAIEKSSEEESKLQPEEESEHYPTQICEEDNEDDKSDTSTITGFQEPMEDKSNIDLTRISNFLDRMEGQLTGQNISDKESSSKSITDGNKLQELIDNFGTQKASKSDEQEKLMEESKEKIAKLSALLAKKVDQPAGADIMEQSALESLPSLLSKVLEKMEEASSETDSKKKESPNKALEALFAKRASLQEEDKAKENPLSEDPEYEKYFKMLKLGLPRASVIQAMERDGKDPSILDLDPNSPLVEQRKKLNEPAQPDKDASLKALFAKKSASVKENDEKAGPNKNTGALEALFAKRSEAAKPQQEDNLPLRADPEYQKYMKMLKVGMPKEQVRVALERDGKDPNVADMDPEMSYISQVSREKDANSDKGTPLKDDLEYAKFFKMLKVRPKLSSIHVSHAPVGSQV